MAVEQHIHELQQRIANIDQYYRAEIAWRDAQLVELRNLTTSLETAVRKLQNDVQDIKIGVAACEEHCGRGHCSSDSKTVAKSHDQPDSHSTNMSNLHSSSTYPHPQSLQNWDGSASPSYKQTSTVMSDNAQRQYAVTSPTVYDILGFGPPTTDCSDELPPHVTIPDIFACPDFKFDLPPYPIEKRVTALYDRASSVDALPVFEYFFDERNWPNWAKAHFHNNDPGRPMIKDRRLVIAMLVLQDSWKRSHSFPLGDPDNIVCNGVCTGHCSGNNRKLLFKDFPTLWGWPSWPEVKQWEVEKKIARTKKLRTPLAAKVGEHQEMWQRKEAVRQWVRDHAARENSMLVDRGICGCKFRDGKFFATIDDIRRARNTGINVSSHNSF